MARVELQPRAVERLKDEMVTEYHRVKAPLILILMQMEAPIDTGMLRASGTVDPVIYRDGATRIIRWHFDTSYVQYVFAGRGIVRPVRAQALRWVTKAGVVVFAKQSRAVPPNRWTLRVFIRLGYRNPIVGRR